MKLTQAASFVALLTPVLSSYLPGDLEGRYPSQCKCYEGDACWPSLKQWNTLNTTVGGRLRKVVPFAAPCYNSFEGIPTYNEEACETATAGFGSAPWMIENSQVSPVRTYPSNNTCLPTENRNGTCAIGYLSEYVIMAETREHVKAGVDFARQTNVRLVVRNTGHDFMGRSVAAGSLAINTHALKGTTFTKSYKGPGKYTGGAVTVGAGVQGRDLYRQAYQQNPKVMVVGGECPTVGFAGGYILGGGHGPLSTFLGMAADHALAFEVVTADGKYAVANEKENSDLFWALKGGGPSFAIVTSLTVKTFPEVKAAGTIVNINSTHTTDSALFWNAVGAFHSLSNHYVDNGMFVYYELSELRLHIQPFVAPNYTASQIKAALKPLFTKLDALGVKYDTVTKEFSTWFDLYIDMFEDEGAGDNTIVGGRFFTRQDVQENSPALQKAFQNAVNPPNWPIPGIIVGHIFGPGHGNPVVDNAIHPGWRDAVSFSITVLIVPTDADKATKAQAWDVLTNTVDKGLIDAAPYGGSYVNEGNLEQPDWQTSYWGSNYPRLYRTKEKWDPKGMFYARTVVGSEKWVEVGDPPRLCKA